MKVPIAKEIWRSGVALLAGVALTLGSLGPAAANPHPRMGRPDLGAVRGSGGGGALLPPRPEGPGGNPPPPHGPVVRPVPQPLPPVVVPPPPPPNHHTTVVVPPPVRVHNTVVVEPRPYPVRWWNGDDDGDQVGALVAGLAIGAVVASVASSGGGAPAAPPLPAGYQTLQVNGQTYYKVGDQYVKPYYEGNQVVYRVVPDPIR